MAFGQGRRNAPLSGDYMPSDILAPAPDEHPLHSLIRGVLGLDKPQPMDEHIPNGGEGASLSSPAAPASSSPETGGPSILSPHAAGPQPIDTSHLSELEAKRQKMEQPLSWKARLLRTGEMALPVALGAALGGRAGATGALQGDQQYEAAQLGRQAKEKDSLVKQIEDERTRVNQQQMERTRLESEAPLRAAQISNYGSEDALRKAQIQNYANEEAHRGDKPPTTDEFERLWANDPSHYDAQGNLKHPTLKDKTDYEVGLHKGERQPPYPTYTPTVDAAGNITGRFNNRSGLAEKVGQAPEAGSPQRKTEMPGAQVTREIQATAIENSKKDLFSYIDKNLGITGPLKGRWNNVTALWGDTSPEAQELKGKIMSYASLQPGLHGMRNVQMVKEIQDRLGNTKLTAKALKAGLEGLSQAATSIKSATADFYGTKGGTQGQVEEWGRDANGKLVKKNGQ